MHLNWVSDAPWHVSTWLPDAPWHVSTWLPDAPWHVSTWLPLLPYPWNHCQRTLTLSAIAQLTRVLFN
ncbi:hypothetical protein [Coleofasciculus sp. F4-SAH-05]|uniref:hypothetical protein n=1 Tax=Coleofasciculus sp. F4-SAH-05 TaxID=3069525 RepID=UPI0032F6670D